jgi:hypothetical protein
MDWVGETAFSRSAGGSLERISLLRSCPDISNGEEIFCVNNNTAYGLFLVPGVEYSLTVHPANPVIKVKTRRWIDGRATHLLPIEQLTGFVAEDYPKNILREILLKSKDEYLLTISSSAAFWSRLFQLGLFALDSEDGVVVVPNPTQKFCFNLARDVRWKVREKWSDDFEFRVSDEMREVVEGIRLCRDWHASNKTGSTWITNRFMENIVEISRISPEIKFVIFSLIDKKTGAVASVSVGYRFGANFMDFTACTPVRDNRSPGKLLLKRECEYLRSQGVKLWYLGFKLGYMDSLSEDSLLLSRCDFQEFWDNNCPSSRDLQRK